MKIIIIGGGGAETFDTIFVLFLKIQTQLRKLESLQEKLVPVDVSIALESPAQNTVKALLSSRHVLVYQGRKRERGHATDCEQKLKEAMEKQIFVYST